LFAFLVLSIGRKFPRIFFVSIHEGLTGARGKSSPYLIAESIKTYCAGDSVSSGARRTLGTYPLLTANFTRS